MSFQWDALLLEAGFLAIFLGWSNLVPWMFRWLLFRLMFMSGVVKLASGDPSWRALTAHALPLPDAAAADTAGLVHAPIAGVVPERSAPRWCWQSSWECRS